MTSSRKETHYETLRVERSATTVQIKAAYKSLALKWHPDRNITNKELATERFKQIAHAHEVLSDGVKRRLYDLSLPDLTPPPPRQQQQQQHMPSNTTTPSAPPTPPMWTPGAPPSQQKQRTQHSAYASRSSTGHDSFKSFFTSSSSSSTTNTTTNNNGWQSSEHIFTTGGVKNGFDDDFFTTFDDKHADKKTEQSFRRTFKTWLERHADSRVLHFIEHGQWTPEYSFASFQSQTFIHASSRDQVLLVMNQLFTMTRYRITDYKLRLQRGMASISSTLQIEIKQFQ